MLSTIFDTCKYYLGMAEATPEANKSSVSIASSSVKVEPQSLSGLSCPKYIVYEGGGIKGITYTDTIDVLSKTGLLNHIEAVGGASVGAITSLIVATGQSPEEIKHTLTTLNFAKLTNGPWWNTLLIPYNLYYNYGCYTATGIYDWLGDTIEKVTGSPDTTFEEWHNLTKINSRLKDIYIKTTNKNDKTSEDFSWKSEKNKHVKIRDAIRASMAVPLYFTPWKIQDALYEDGGVLDNCPYSLFTASNSEFNPNILIFRADSKEEIHHYEKGIRPPAKEINSLWDSLISTFGLVLKAQDELYHFTRYSKESTIYCDELNISTLNFHPTPEEIAAMNASGEYAAIRFLNKKYPEVLSGLYSQKFLEKVKKADASSIVDFLNYKSDEFFSLSSKDGLENPRKRWKTLSYFGLKKQEKPYSSFSDSAELEFNPFHPSHSC